MLTNKHEMFILEFVELKIMNEGFIHEAEYGDICDPDQIPADKLGPEGPVIEVICHVCLETAQDTRANLIDRGWDLAPKISWCPIHPF
jgi:hypothetical protein